MASSSAGLREAESKSPPAAVKPAELEDPLNHYVYHPMARRLAAWLQPTGVSPNAVSVMSAFAVVAAAFAYAGLDWPLSVLIGLAFHLSWHVFDGADGELARLTGRASPFGELVDGAADYIGHGVMYVALAVILDDWLGIWAWLLSTLSAFSRTAQSNHAETQRRTYLWRVYGVPWLKQAQASGDELFERKGLLATIFIRGFARGYIKLAGATSPHSAEIDAALEQTSDPRETLRLKRLCRQSSRSSILLQHALGANPRTILLGISMAMGSPLYFFIVEIGVLNLVLAVSIAHQRRCNRALVARLAGPRAPPANG